MPSRYTAAITSNPENAFGISPDGNGLVKVGDASPGVKNVGVRFTDANGWTKDAVIPVTVTGTPYTLADLALSGLTYPAGSPAGTVIANITGKLAGSTLSITPNDGRLAFTGNDVAGWQLVVGASASSVGSIAATIYEDKAGASNNHHPTAVTLTVTSSTFAVGTTVGVLAHSFEENYYSGAASYFGNTQIASSFGSALAHFMTLQTALRLDVYFKLHYGMLVGTYTGSWNVGDVVKQTQTFTGSITGSTLTITATPSGNTIQRGATISGPGITAGTKVTAAGTGRSGNGTYTVDTNHGTPTGSITISQDITGVICAPPAPGKITVNQTTGTFNLSSVAGVVTNVTTGATGTVTTADYCNVDGGMQGLAGDTLDAMNGNMGILARVALMAQLPRPPGVIFVTGLINGLVSGLTAATSIAICRTVYDAIRAESTLASSLVVFENCGAWASSSGYNTALGQAGRQKIADTNTGLLTAMALWPGWGSTVKYGDIFSLAFNPAPASMAAACADFAAASGTVYPDAGLLSDGLHPAHGWAYRIGKMRYQLTKDKITAGDYFTTTYGSSNYITSQAGFTPGTGGTVTTNATKAVPGDQTSNNPVAAVPTAIDVKYSGTGAVKCWTEDGGQTQTDALADGDTVTIGSVGERVLCIEYTVPAVTAESTSITVQWNTITGGPFVGGTVTYAQFDCPVWSDASGVLAGIRSHLGIASDLKAFCLDMDVTTQGKAGRMPTEAGMRRYRTPPYKLDGSQAANGKAAVVLLTSSSATPGSKHVIRIPARARICAVADPSA